METLKECKSCINDHVKLCSCEDFCYKSRILGIPKWHARGYNSFKLIIFLKTSPFYFIYKSKRSLIWKTTSFFKCPSTTNSNSKVLPTDRHFKLPFPVETPTPLAISIIHSIRKPDQIPTLPLTRKFINGQNPTISRSFPSRLDRSGNRNSPSKDKRVPELKLIEDRIKPWYHHTIS